MNDYHYRIIKQNGWYIPQRMSAVYDDEWYILTTYSKEYSGVRNRHDGDPNAFINLHYAIPYVEECMEKDSYDVVWDSNVSAESKLEE